MRYQYSDIENLVYKAFVASGAKASSAQMIACNLVLTEAAGVTTHGLRMVRAHVEKYKRHLYYDEDLICVREISESFARVEANNTMGIVSATKAMRKAIEETCNKPFYVVASGNCNTFGAAFTYAQMALDQGLIGVALSNSPAQMAPLNGKQKMLGTNPIAIGIPAKQEPAFLLDMATSVVAKSRINEAKDKGTRIPKGWALDENGEETEDPLEAIKGFVLPMAGAKGYGLSMAIDIMCGLMTGSAYLDSVGRFYGSDEGMNIGQLFVCVNPRIIYGKNFYEEMDQYLKRIKCSDCAKGAEITYPGEHKFRLINEAKHKGLSISEEIYKEIQQLSM